MELAKHKITPCLWFDGEAEDAAKFYVSIFKNAKLGNISRYGKEGFEIHGRKEGTVMVAEWEIAGQKFVGLNGGPQFKFSEAISFQISCENQEEVDYFWSRLTAGGGQESMCGWLKDRFGLSWQVVPTALFEMLQDRDAAKAQRVTKAFLQMRKFDIAALRRAFEGKELVGAKQ
jgi:predicted 3-demethylubiquinone-9 3-methyltransferase (glyoxalase superfamily)